MSEPDTVTCRHCGALHRLINGRLCQHCGVSAVPPARDKEAELELRRCLKCGVPAPGDASRCRSCGNPMLAPEEPPAKLFVDGDGQREIALLEGPPVEIAKGPVRMASVEESLGDVDLPPGPPVELATEPVRMDPPHFREVEIE